MLFSSGGTAPLIPYLGNRQMCVCVCMYVDQLAVTFALQPT